MLLLLARLWADDNGYQLADYALTFAVIVVILAGTFGLIHSNTNVALWSSH